MIEKSDCLQLGFISKTHGIKGEMVLRILDGLFFESLDTDFLFVEIDKGLVPFYIEELRPKTPNTLLVTFEGINAEERAKRLVGKEVYADKALLDNQSTGLTPLALIGYNVFDERKGAIGSIKGIQKSSKNPLFEIDFQGKEILIPINEDLIVTIDEESKTLRLNVPEGLIDLYLD